MTTTISKAYHWSASHVLDGLPDGHPCGRLHGHNYTTTFTVTGDVDETTGFILDYHELDRVVGSYIDDHLDHRHLNDGRLFGDGANPTAERIASRLAGVAVANLPETVRLVAVEVKETAKTAATWTR